MSTSFVIRLDVSPRVGLGHYTRCSALAAALRASGGVLSALVIRGSGMRAGADLPSTVDQVLFVDERATTAEDAAACIAAMESARADVLIVDSYAVDEEYQRLLWEAGIRWLQFDSHARQRFWAEWVLHASPGATPDIYEPLRTRDETQFLLGPEYAVLDIRFRLAHLRARRRERVRRVLLCLGGGDDGDATLTVLKAVAPAARGWVTLDVVVGFSHPRADEIGATIKRDPDAGTMRFHVGTPAMHELMLAADLAIVSGGTLSYECCSTGLPMLLVCMAANQSMNVRGWVEKGAAISVGDASTLNAERLLDACAMLSSKLGRLQAMSAAALGLVDGRGAERAARELLGEGIT